jgi:hypothetical protein
MTIVITRRRGEEMLFLVDTMVSDRDQTGPSVFPGRLKVVTIGPRLTAAFAGDADPAGVAIQEARRALLGSGCSAAVDVLQKASRDGRTDFLVGFHSPQARLVRLRQGASLEVSEMCTLGHDEPFRDLIERERASTSEKPLRKSDLRFGFIDRLGTGKHSHPDIGGFPIAVEATPTGHRYLGCGMAYSYDIEEKWGEKTEQPIEQISAGEGHFTFSVIPSESVDVPVVGACLLQARQGFVFSPMQRPEPFVIPLGPPESEWRGRENEILGVLKKALAEHVAAVTKS